MANFVDHPERISPSDEHGRGNSRQRSPFRAQRSDGSYNRNVPHPDRGLFTYLYGKEITQENERSEYCRPDYELRLNRNTMRIAPRSNKRCSESRQSSYIRFEMNFAQIEASCSGTRI
jgi:hypothetical protein